MKSLEELSMTKTDDIKDFFNKIILDSIERVTEANRFGRQLTRIYDLKGESADSITIAMEQDIEEPEDILEGDSAIPSKIALTPKEIEIEISIDSAKQENYCILADHKMRLGYEFAHLVKQSI